MSSTPILEGLLKKCDGIQETTSSGQKHQVSTPPENTDTTQELDLGGMFKASTALLQASTKMFGGCAVFTPQLAAALSLTFGQQTVMEDQVTNTSSSSSSDETDGPLYCVVCGDLSSGRHYGVLSCNGCSCFFKRSIRGKMRYTCREGTNNCPIYKAIRNTCTGCRFRTCLQKGMHQHAVQGKRGRRPDPIVMDYAEYLHSLTHPEVIEVGGMDNLVTVDSFEDLAMTKMEEIVKFAVNFRLFADLPQFQKRQILMSQWPRLLLLSMCSEQLDDAIFGQIQKKFQNMDISMAESDCLKAILLFMTADVTNQFGLQLDQCICLLQQCTLPLNFSPCRMGKLLLFVSEVQFFPTLHIEKIMESKVAQISAMIDVFESPF